MSDLVDLEQLISVISLLPNPVAINRYQECQEGEYSSDDFVYVNPAFINTIGYTVEDIPDDKTWFEKACPEKSYRDYITHS